MMPTNFAMQGQCNAFSLPPGMLDEYKAVAGGVTNFNFSFIGYEDFAGM